VTTIAAPDRRLRLRDIAQAIISRREYGVAILLVLTVAIVSIVNPRFIALDNIRDLLVNAVPGAIIGCGMTFVIVTGEIDISVGSSLGLCAAVLGLLASPTHAHLPVFIAVLITLAVATGIGAINAFLITIANVPSIIVTLAMLSILFGVNQKVLHGEWVTDLPQGLRHLALGTIASIPIPLLVAGVVAIGSSIFAIHTALGRRIYAVGSSPHAARLAGVSPRRIKFFVFTFTGLLVGIATAFSVPQQATIESNIGIGFELFVVTAVVVGGTSISGGRGSILGTLLAILLLGSIRSVLLFLQLKSDPTYWERAIQGGFILLAVLADQLGRRRQGDDVA